MPPVAKRQLYPKGTAQRVLQDAVADTYAADERFFEDLAKKLHINPDSAGGTYYGVLRLGRPLPRAHRKWYLELTTVTPEVLDDLEEQWQAERTPAQKGRLAELEEEVAALRDSTVLLLEVSTTLAAEVVKLGGRVPRRMLDALRQAVAGKPA